MPHIILLRAPTPVSESIGNARDSGEPNGLDPYEAALNPFNSTSIPVYETLQKLDELTNILDTDPSAQGLNGVVVTSKRAVDAWASAVENVLDDGKSWQSVPFYVVGEATGHAVHEMKKRFEASGRSRMAPREILGAEEAGTGEQLAHFIVSRLPARGRPEEVGDRLKLLFLTGDKTKDSLPTILGADPRVELASVAVYATIPSHHLPDALLRAIEKDQREKDWWIVAFAPSGVSYALPYLQNYFSFDSCVQDELKSIITAAILPRARFAAIGPTTASHLRENLSLRVSAVASKPKPEELAKAIRAVYDH